MKNQAEYSHQHHHQLLTSPVLSRHQLRARPHGVNQSASNNPPHDNNNVVFEALSMALEIHREFQDIISRVTEENSTETQHDPPTRQ